MKKKSRSRTKRTTTKSVLRLPDLDYAKAAVLNSLASPEAQRGYRHAINEFVDLVVPELQRRGLFRTEYEGATLRENLGVPFPN